MTAPFEFRCPSCGASHTSDRDPGGTQRTCERCGRPFAIKAAVPGGERTAPISLLPPIDDARAALEAWQAKVWFVPEHFSREAELSELEPAFTLSAEIVQESRSWKQTNGEPPPDPWSLQAPAPTGDLPLEFRVPDSERRTPCAACGAAGEASCANCAGLGRARCDACAGTGCSGCGGGGTVSCSPCSGKGKIECSSCEGAKTIPRANVLEIRRRIVKRQSSKTPSHPLSPKPSTPAKPLFDLRSRSRAETKRRLERLPVSLKSTLVEFLEGLTPEDDYRVISERLTVEQIPVWKASWKLGKRSGFFWLHDEPLRARVPYPPRNALLFAITAWTALMGVGFIVFLFIFFRGRNETPPEAGPAAIVPPKTKDSPAAPSAPAAPAQALSEDGLILLTDGRIVRGPMSRDGIAVIVQGAEDRVTAAPWQIEIVEPKAADFIRSHLELLVQLEKSIAQAVAPETKPSRPALVARLLELHRHRDRWTRLQPLCRAGELPSGPSPVDRIDALKDRLDAALDAKPTPPAGAGATPAPPNAVPGAPAPAPVAPPPELVNALDELGKIGDASTRLAAAQTIVSFINQEGIPRDLLVVAWLLLSRPEREWKLESDRLEARSATVGGSYEGILEVTSSNGIVLRVPSGEKIIATRAGGGPWSVRAPGGVTVSAEDCVAIRSAPTRARALLWAHYERIPPRLWLATSPENHLIHAKALAEALAKEQSPEDRGMQVIRMLTAAHAATAMRFGSVSAIEGARALLVRLGFVSSPSGAWQTEDDAMAVTLGKLLQEGRFGDALALVPQPQGTHGFGWWYRAAAVRLTNVMTRREDLTEGMRVLDRTSGLASSETEVRHLQVLKDSLSLYRVCGKCGGDSLSTCSVCHGKGTLRTICGRCSGHGVIIVVGKGGGTMTCPACGGRPDSGLKLCTRCAGNGKVDCPNCRGIFRPPRPADVCWLEPCPFCARMGVLGEMILYPCPACQGLGMRLVPARSPDTTLR